MKFLIITHVAHVLKSEQIYAYGPYIRELNLWIKGVNEVVILAPGILNEPDAIALPITRQVHFREVPAFDIRSLQGILDTSWKLPKIMIAIVREMSQADHIHLRCPGNMGLLGCIVQIAFPHKKKTAKYAGNWDPNSVQPWSYQLQRWILNNPFLTRNMQVLAYGYWPDQSKNILPFFTASYREAELLDSPPRSFAAASPIQLIFVGSLLVGKRPMIAVKAAELLLQRGIQVFLHVYGDGPERSALEDYIKRADLSGVVVLHGNVSAEEIKAAYIQSHFLLFPSQSEGWPKAVAEAMWWGCLPITTPVSCVPQMLGNGARGDLIDANPSSVAQAVHDNLNQPELYREKCLRAMEWSRQFTLERFEVEIQKLL